MFGIEFPDKIGSCGGTHSNIKQSIVPFSMSDSKNYYRNATILIFLAPDRRYAKYIQVYYYSNYSPSTKEECTPSKLYEIPAELPAAIFIELPENTSWTYYDLYDENKQRIEPQIKYDASKPTEAD